ncbi:MAG: hypothetical protein JST00_35450 [Deltaproteobacteria bacterium]|nr:hypothetical protein [Deltaproteobacteria bacterium]
MTTAAVRTVRCGRCKTTYTPSAFADLAKVVTLDHEELTPIVSEWPSGVIVEVRSCRSCSTPIACLATPERPLAEDAVR